MRPYARRRTALPALTLGLALAVTAACAPATPTSASASAAPPANPVGLGTTWQAAAVELPDAVTGQAGGTTDIHCSPCHSVAVDLLFGVAPTATGFVAVGVQEPPPMAVAWRSSDGRRWAAITDLPAGDDSVATAVAANGQRVVIVGGNAQGATSWASADGTAWTAAPSSGDLATPAGGAAQMTAVSAWEDGFVAVGYQDDPAHGHAMAAIWTSSDGLAWHRVSSGEAFQDQRLFGVAVLGGTIVTVGTGVDLFGGPAVAWTSRDGRAWVPVSSPALGAGPMRAITTTPSGFEAVGFGAQDDRAVAWTSPDGVAWQVAPDDPAFANHGQPIRMAAVAAGSAGLVAVGWKSDAGNGSGAVWRSPDGLTWQRDPDQVSFVGGELDGVAIGPAGPMAAGIAGYPDNDQASVWLGPP